MVRPPLSHYEHARGERLGTLLREARGTRSMAEIAAVSGVPAETLRKIETGRIATPAFFTVAALAAALGLALEDLAHRCGDPGEELAAQAG
jgi:transcriptional regulator with XRE-family HTH domain